MESIIFPMTFSTKGYNVKMMFWCITFIMMILFGLFSTITTFEQIGLQQFTCDNGTSNCISCRIPIRMSHYIFFGGTATYYFALFALMIMILNVTFSFRIAFAPFIIVYLVTLFAITSITTRAVIAFVKFRERFNLFATRTSFCYDFVSHIRSFQRLWSEPVVPTIGITGSFIVCDSKGNSK